MSRDAPSHSSQKIWDQRLRRMVGIGQADKREALKDSLILLALAFIARRDGLSSVELGEEPAEAARTMAKIIEAHGDLKGQPISDTLLSGLPGVKADILSEWLFVASESAPIHGFAEWFAEKLDELEFARHHDTPLSLSRLIASLLSDRSPRSIFDPACGSGGLLASVAEKTGNAALFGQEVSAEACAWAQLRFLVLGLKDAKLAVGNALTQPAFPQSGLPRRFDLVLSNPPFGIHFDTGAVLHRSSDLSLEASPSSRISSETAYIHEIFGMLSTSGIGAVIVPMGFLTRGGIDQKLREALIQRDAVQTVVALPLRLFAPASSIESAILFLNRQKTARQKDRILFVDARRLGRREGIRTVLDDASSCKIKETFTSWDDKPEFACSVPLSGLEGSGCSLSPARYVGSLATQTKVHAGERRARMTQLDRRLADLTAEFETLRSRLVRTS